eukprot:scaffold11057_cov68-Skeletonema_dohrnii-CCMP3373.AAC.1
MSTAEREHKDAREGRLDHASASLEAVLAFLASLDDMKSIYSSTAGRIDLVIQFTYIPPSYFGSNRRNCRTL